MRGAHHPLDSLDSHNVEDDGLHDNLIRPNHGVELLRLAL